MIQEPLVSIIIPTYNRAHLIGETLDSIVAQTYKNWECIIVDDGSNDNTDEVVNRYIEKDIRFQYHHRPDCHKRGGNGARNYGFELSKGVYINWFDSDDLMLNNFIKNALFFHKNYDIDFVIYDYKVFKSSIDNIILIQKNKTNNLLQDYVTQKINFGTCAILWNKNIVSDFRFNELLTKAQDLDFNFRIFTKKKIKYITANEFGFLVREHSNSIVKDYNMNKIESVYSELFARKNVFLYVMKFSNNRLVREKSFQLYCNPIFKLIKIKKTYLILKEIYFLYSNNSGFVFKNLLWFLKTIFWLSINFIFNKAYHKLKIQFLKYNFN